MATIINSISFQNFYNYYGNLEDNCFNFTTGINIISADNNMGKTKFYNGFLWMLIDQVYDTDTKRIMPVRSSFKNMASVKAKSEGNPFTMAVQITYTKGNEKYKVTKVVNFSKTNGEWRHLDQIVEVEELSNNITTPIYDINQQAKIIENIIPIQLRKYALLQGETMESIVDLSSKEGLQNTIEALADIGDVVKIRASCKELTKQAKSFFNDQQRRSNQRNAEGQQLITEKEELEKRISDTEERLENINIERSRAIEAKDRFEAIIENATSREKYRAEISSVNNEIQKLENEKKRYEEEITSKIFSDIPWLLMGHDKSVEKFTKKRDDWVCERTRKQFQDQIYKNAEAILLPEGSPDIPSLKRMLDKERCEVCGRIAEKGTEAWLNIKKLIDRPQQTVPTTANDFTKFFGDIQRTAGNIECSEEKIKKDLLNYKNDLDNITCQIEEKKRELENIRTRFINVGGSTDNADKDKTNLSEYNTAEENIRKYTDEINKSKENINRWRIRISQIDEKLSANDPENSIKKIEEFRDIMICVEQLFENAKERIFDRILDSLGKVANDKYNELLKGNPVQGGRIFFNKTSEGNVSVSIKNADDGELTGLGTGFQRMKQLSIIMAIISTKIGDNRFDYPFISDAPFSEFGDNFIRNFFRIAPEVFTQSIIMVKDLYDINSDTKMNTLGNEIFDKMKSGNIPGSFYVLFVEDNTDVTSLTTKSKKYI